jgi:hypothetical protein
MRHSILPKLGVFETIVCLKNYLVWDKLTIGQRKGNKSSRRGMANHGFQFKKTEEINWPDDTRNIEYRYELDLKGLR